MPSQQALNIHLVPIFGQDHRITEFHIHFLNEVGTKFLTMRNWHLLLVADDNQQRE